MMPTYRHRAYINFPMLLRVIGWLLMILAAFMVIPMCVSFIYGEQEALMFLLSIGITLAVGFSLMSLRPRSRDMGRREAIFLTASIWVILSLFGMLPFLLCGTHLNVTDAFFETMSGFTTTGASVLSTLEDIPHSILLWRCLIQWVGGMGIILFTLAVVPMLNYQGGMQMFNAEVTGITHDKLRPRVSLTAKSLWLVYICLTVLLTVLIIFSGIDVFDALCLGLSTMSTGGFSTPDLSDEASAGLYIKIVMTVFMFLGGINFALIYKSVTGQWKRVVRDDALRWYGSLTLIAAAVLCLNVVVNGLVHDLSDVTIDPLFQAVSIMSSTGITEPDFHDWGSLSVIVLIVMMFTGACAGSTSGGAKIDRVIVLYRFLKNEFYKVMHPSAVTTVTINGKGMSYVLVQKVIAFLFVYLLVIMAGGTVLAALGLPLKDSFFVCLSAISNTGIGTSITGISGSFTFVPCAAKWILSFIMLVGRLELFTVLLLFTPGFWRK